MTTLFEGSLLDISIVDENELSLSESSNSAYLTLLDKNRISKSILTKKINDDNILTLEFDISSNDTKEFIIDPALSRKILDIKNDTKFSKFSLVTKFSLPNMISHSLIVFKRELYLIVNNECHNLWRLGFLFLIVSNLWIMEIYLSSIIKI